MSRLLGATAEVAGTAYTEKDKGVEVETSIGKVVGYGFGEDYPSPSSYSQYQG